MSLPEELIEILTDRRETVSTAESLTGGLLCATLTDVSGAGEAVLGAVVAYDTAIKNTVLGVDPHILREYGAVSEQTAMAMARQARRLLGSTWALSTTGVAGPTTQEGKPVGTVFVAVDGPKSAVAPLNLDGDREQIRLQTCAAACALLRSCLE